jgi:hypothetical protein
MGGVFWVAAAASALLAVLASIPGVVIGLTFMSGFLLAPVWPVAANLWWVMLLLAPVVWFYRRGKPLFGIAVSAGLAIACVGAFYGMRSSAMARIEAPFFTTPGAIEDGAGLPRVVDLTVNADGVLGEAACDPLCDALLTGDAVTTVRRTTIQSDQPARTHVFQRSDPAGCRQLDPDFPLDAACILMVADDGRAADLRVMIDGAGDGYASRDEVGGLAYLVSSRRIRVTDLRGDEETLIHDQSWRIWFEAISPVPLFANSGFDGNGLHGGGLAPYRARKSDPRLDPGAILASLGVPIGAGRMFVETKPAQVMMGETFPAEGYFGPMPYDVALVASILEIMDRPDEGIGTMIQDWVERLERGAPNTATTRAIIGQLPAFLGTQAFALQRLTSLRPELFVDRFEDFYAQVQSNNENVSQLAAFTILGAVRGDPLGTHDADADAYLAALRAGKHWDALIQIVGRYGFDPTPIFQAELDRRRGEAYMHVLFHVYTAAKITDPKWNSTVGPLLHQTLLPLMDDLVANRAIFRDGTQALQALGRSDLVDDLFARVDWNAVIARERAEGTTSGQLKFVQRGYFPCGTGETDC